MLQNEGIIEKMNKSLTVYKASAGSGKTFTLTVEYISILVSDPENYRKILAVTFTNKATQEMKMRILSQLYGIAYSLPSSEDYFQQVEMNTGLKELVIRKNAKEALTLLLHRYNEFRVQTIDAFFQQVLRNLARELDLTANLRIDLNDTQIMQTAVDQMIEALQPNDKVLKWIHTYINTRIEDDKGWNVIGKIKEFGKNIFKDFYREEEHKVRDFLQDESLFNAYVAKLRQMRRDFEKETNARAVSILDELKIAHVDDASFLAQHLYGYIYKKATERPVFEPMKGYVKKAIETPKGWVSSKAPAAEKEILMNLAANSLCEKLKVLEELRDEDYATYVSCQLTLEHLSELRLLDAIAQKVNELNRDNNRFLLANTQGLLSKFISGTDAPFVFEKIGARLKHIMIDEFQDTSTIQWKNFKALLDNCLAQEHSRNLIVGDIKQSIYRWRAGDWRLLNDIDKPASNGFHKEQVEIKTLANNYRSEKRIVAFNNAFFEEMVKATINELEANGIPNAHLIGEAYADVVQVSPKYGEEGYVQLDLYAGSGETYRKEILSNLVRNVEQLLDLGYQQNEIAILVRSKNVVQDIATAFVSHFNGSVNLISEEAFRLDASLAINVLIAALHLLTHPDDTLVRGKLVKMYRQQVLQSGEDDTEILVNLNHWEEKQSVLLDRSEKRFLEEEAHVRKLNSSLPEKFVQEREKLLAMPLVDLIDQLYVLFQLNCLEGQSTYVCTFYDTLNDYLRSHPADIDDFIREWEKTLSSQTIQSTEVDGIRLMTIHKSKGLEFENVLIPFCDWDMLKGDVLWCKTEEKPAPFNEIPLIPIDFKKDMVESVYEKEYKEEYFQDTLDQLNLLYVGLTRAARNLFISGSRMSDNKYKEYAKIPKSSNRSQGIEFVLENIANKLSDCQLNEGKDSVAFKSLTYGELKTPEQKKGIKKEIENPFLIAVETQKINVRTFPRLVDFRQSNKSKDFVQATGDEPLGNDRNRYIKMGNILHQVFSTIYTKADVAQKLKALEQEGIIYNDEITTEELVKFINTAFEDEQVERWFSDRWQLFNECSIIEYDEKTDEVREHRPDRVMTDGREIIIVDFKFGKPRKEYQQQVVRYMNLLRSMGNEQVKGYLWYVMRKEIVEVKQ